MNADRGKGANPPQGIETSCDLCELKFRTTEALEVHMSQYHPGRPSPPDPQDEPLNFEPGGTVADYETGPRPGGKLDRETSRPAKRWETPGEGGDPQKGSRNEGVAPIEFPPDSPSTPKKARKKPAP